MAFAEVSLDRVRELGYDPTARTDPGAPKRLSRRERQRYRRSRISPLPVVTHVRGTAEFRLRLDDGPLLVTPARARELVQRGHARLVLVAS